jgi:transketolase
MNHRELAVKSFELRRDVAELIYKSGGGHFGGDFSVMDILVTLYYQHLNIWPERIKDPDRDRFILSKGHSVEALYAVLCDRGFFSREELTGFLKFGAKYIGHPNNKVTGIEINSGSLGHGLPVGVGMALAGKMDDRSYRVYIVMGDGELAEGSVWEGAMAAAHYSLDNMIAIIDRNGLQISGQTETVMTQENLADRWKSFGWYVLECAGNDITSLDTAINEAKTKKGRPVIIIAKTVKGYGYSGAENQTGWHHKVPNEEQYKEIIAELDIRRREIR